MIDDIDRYENEEPIGQTPEQDGFDEVNLVSLLMENPETAPPSCPAVPHIPNGARDSIRHWLAKQVSNDETQVDVAKELRNILKGMSVHEAMNFMNALDLKLPLLVTNERMFIYSKDKFGINSDSFENAANGKSVSGVAFIGHFPTDCSSPVGGSRRKDKTSRKRSS